MTGASTGALRVNRPLNDKTKPISYLFLNTINQSTWGPDAMVCLIDNLPASQARLSCRSCAFLPDHRKAPGPRVSRNLKKSPNRKQVVSPAGCFLQGVKYTGLEVCYGCTGDVTARRDLEGLLVTGDNLSAGSFSVADVVIGERRCTSLGSYTPDELATRSSINHNVKGATLYPGTSWRAGQII